MRKAHNERCRDCKESLLGLLATIYGDVQVNHDIDFPSNIHDLASNNTYFDLAPIYEALKKHRGHSDLVKANRLPRVDFFIPNKNIIIEFDESQYFTDPRGIALGLYPKTKPFGFSVDRWGSLCRDLNKRDNDPPYRDEQRAWYDTLRDFAPQLWKSGKTFRLYSRDLVWCSLDQKKSDLDKFRKILLDHSAAV